MRGNRSGDSLNCRFRDATGQTFQSALGRLDWTGWQPVRVDLHARADAGHWGGADDGVPHPPLSWDALLLIDSSRRHGEPQSILVAAPYYEMER